MKFDRFIPTLTNEPEYIPNVVLNGKPVQSNDPTKFRCCNTTAGQCDRCPWSHACHDGVVTKG